MSEVTAEALKRAADVLEHFASGAKLEQGAALEAALTLRNYADLRMDIDLLDAATGLEAMATDGEFALARHRAAVLAKRVRAETSA